MLSLTQSLFNLTVRYQSQLERWMQTIYEELHPSQSTDEELVRRAAFFVRNGAIKVTNYDPYKHSIDALVQDVVPVHVRLFITDESSFCSCPAEEFCRHRLSVLFSLYQQKSSLSEWLQGWRLKKTEQLSLLANERTPESWTAIVESTFLAVSSESSWKERYRIDYSINTIQKKIKKFTPFEREWQPLYRLFTSMVLLRLLFTYTDEHDLPLFRTTMQTEIEDIQLQLQALANKPRLFAADPFYDALGIQIREIAYSSSGLFSTRFQLVHLFWEHLFTEKRKREMELSFLEEHRHEESPLFLALFYVLLKRTDSLQQIVNSLQAEEIVEWMYVAKLAKSLDDMESLRIILLAIRPHIHEFVNSSLSPWNRSQFVTQLYALYRLIEMPDEQREELFWQFGSFGLRAYSDFLIDQKRYTDWVALHHRFASSLDYAESCGMKTVLLEAPEAVLPLYHVLAIKEVREKNRHSYKQAVRIWKKMKSAAKKSGKLDYWNSYVTEIQSKYKRLRALQEEIQKGNLQL